MRLEIRFNFDYVFDRVEMLVTGRAGGVPEASRRRPEGVPKASRRRPEGVPKARAVDLKDFCGSTPLFAINSQFRNKNFVENIRFNRATVMFG